MNKIIPTLFIAGLALLTFNISDVRASYGLTITPDTLMPSDTATAELCADITSLTITDAYLVDPTGATYTTTVNIGDELEAGECALWDVPDDFGATLTAGSWVLAIDTEEGNPIFIDFAVSFFVLPESAIGAIAVIGASIAVFGGYIFHKRKSL